jgi:hypothetical protein
MFWQFSKHNPTYTTNIKNERGNPVFFGHSNKDEEHVLLHLTGTLQTALGYWVCQMWNSFFLIRVITKLPNSEQSYKGKVKTHNYINRQNQSTTGKL